MINGKKIAVMPMKAWLDCIQNIIGPQGLKSVLTNAHLEKYERFPPTNEVSEVPMEDLRSLFLSLYELCGDNGMYDLQLRIGRERARIGITRHAALAKTVQVSACLLPEPMKVRMALEKMKEEIEKVYTTQIEVREEDGRFLFIDTWIESEGVMSTVPVCGAFVGILQYTMEWITGYPHDVQEIECRAMGHPADVFRISKIRKR